jgi:hypothetical protein
MGIVDDVWDVHGMKDEYTGKSRGSQSRFFDRGDRKGRWGGGLAREIATRAIHPDFSIRLIEILNCTFDLKWLYQRYIQVVARAIQKTVVGCPVLVKGNFEEAPSLRVFLLEVPYNQLRRSLPPRSQ